MTTEKRADVMEGELSRDLCLDQYPQWLWDRLATFQSWRFGLFMHWGPYCQWNCIESWPLVEADKWGRPDTLKAWTDRGRDLERFRKDYWALNRTFNPVDFNPDAWADAATYAGMKYVAFTTKHHDGFCMFDTRATDYRVTHRDCPFHSHPRANITKEVFDAFRAKDFGVSCYFSKSDWHSPYYWQPGRPAPDRNPNYDTAAHPDVWRKFVEFVHAQVKELMTGFGPIDVLWLDGGQVNPRTGQDIDMPAMAAMARRHQRGLIIADRTVGGLYENILTPEQEVPDAPLGHPWETCMTMGTSWAYVEGDTYKPARQIIHTLVDIVAKDGNLLLNIGPSPRGTFAPDALDRLRDIGDWMTVNSEAIHGSRAIAPYMDGQIRYTSKGDTVYAIVLAEKGQTLPPRELMLTKLRPRAGATVTMLGVDAPLTVRNQDDAVCVTLPAAGKLPCEHAWTVKFDKA